MLGGILVSSCCQVSDRVCDCISIDIDDEVSAIDLKTICTLKSLQYLRHTVQSHRLVVSYIAHVGRSYQTLQEWAIWLRKPTKHGKDRLVKAYGVCVVHQFCLVCILNSLIFFLFTTVRA